jgi:hypothetical protein
MTFRQYSSLDPIEAKEMAFKAKFSRFSNNHYANIARGIQGWQEFVFFERQNCN